MNYLKKVLAVGLIVFLGFPAGGVFAGGEATQISIEITESTIEAGSDLVVTVALQSTTPDWCEMEGDIALIANGVELATGEVTDPTATGSAEYYFAVSLEDVGEYEITASFTYRDIEATSNPACYSAGTDMTQTVTVIPVTTTTSEETTTTEEATTSSVPTSESIEDRSAEDALANSGSSSSAPVMMIAALMIAAGAGLIIARRRA